MKSNNKISNLDSTSEDGYSDTNLNYEEKLNKINKIIYNLDLFSNGYNFDNNYEIMNSNLKILTGGNSKDKDNDTITITLKKYNKIKAFAKAAKNTIIKYKNVAQYYFDSYNLILFNYINLLNLLYKQKNTLEDKIEQYNKLSKDYSNGIDKIKLLETMIGGIEKVIAKTTNLDLEIKNKIDGKELNISASANLIPNKNVEIIDENIKLGGFDSLGGTIMYGGEMNLEEFEEAIEKDIEQLNNTAKEMEEDNKFITDKISKLHDKVKGVIGDAEDLFNIRLSIEWLVNQLEIKRDDKEKIDYQKMYDKLSASINVVKAKQNSPQIAEYLRKLEGMAKELENFIKSSKDTLNTMSDEKKADMLRTLNELHQTADTFLQQGGNLSKFNGGTPFKEAYMNFNNSLSTKLIDEINEINKDGETNYIKIIKQKDDGSYEILNEQSQLDFDPLEDNEKQDELYQLIKMAKHLNYWFDIAFKYLKIYKGFSSVMIQDYKIEEDTFINTQWDKIYSNNDNVEFYLFKVKNWDIIKTEGLLTIPSELKISEMLEKIIKEEYINDTNKYINVVYEKSNLNKTINLINNNIIFYNYLTILLYYILYFEFLINGIEFANDNVQIINMSFQNMTKSKKMYTTSGFRDYLSIRGGADGMDELTTNNKLSKALEEMFSIFNGEITKLNSSIDKSSISSQQQTDLFEKITTNYFSKIDKNEQTPIPIDSVCKEVNTELIRDNKKLMKQMKEIYVKIYDKLEGKPVEEIDTNTTELTIAECDLSGDISVCNSNVINAIKPLIGDDKSVLKSSIGGVGEISYPRIDPYRIMLRDSKDKLKKFYEQANLINSALEKIISEKKISNTTKELNSIYSTLKEFVGKGINSYINVNPMIVFSIEFPPIAYKGQPCSYKFTYNSKNNLVEYNPPNDCNVGKFEIPKLHSHQGFFESTKNDTTQDLMDDSIVGLNKLIETKSGNSDPADPDPTQKVINLMFALGASGTGKTTRYFGSTDSKTLPKDKKGIIPDIIESAKKKNKKKQSKKSDNNEIQDSDVDVESDEEAQTENAEPTSQIKIELAYFICYGRKSSINEPDTNQNNFNEMVIFANIPNLQTKKFKQTDSNQFDNQDFNIYIEANKKSNPTNYIEFYSNLVSSKLTKVEYSDVKNYITDGIEFSQPLSSTPSQFNLTFRQIIEPGNNSSENTELNETNKLIWLDITNVESNDISDIFEGLLDVQKAIHTVLPTKNNIESSRGHTCVLIKITDQDGSKYFPLFDMAGTENVQAMRDFFIKPKSTNPTDNVEPSNNYKNQMNKLIDVVSNLTIGYKVKENGKAFASLNELLTSDIVQKYLEKPKIIESRPELTGFAGGKPDYDIGTNEKENFQNFGKQIELGTNSPDLVDKIIGEGYYINHTIGMLIYVAKCIGQSINSEKIGNDDNFANIQSGLEASLSNYVYTISSSQSMSPNSKPRTRILADGLGFSNIMAHNTIWAQILFSFLYWNEENPQSINKMFGDCIKSENAQSPNIITKYITEQLSLNTIKGLDSEYNNDVNIFGKLKESGKINFDNIIQSVQTKLNQINQELGGTETTCTIESNNNENFSITNDLINNYIKYYENQTEEKKKQKEEFEKYKGNKLSSANYLELLKYIVEQNPKTIQICSTVKIGVTPPTIKNLQTLFNDNKSLLKKSLPNDQTKEELCINKNFTLGELLEAYDKIKPFVDPKTSRNDFMQKTGFVYTDNNFNRITEKILYAIRNIILNTLSESIGKFTRDKITDEQEISGLIKALDNNDKLMGLLGFICNFDRVEDNLDIYINKMTSPPKGIDDKILKQYTSLESINTLIIFSNQELSNISSRLKIDVFKFESGDLKYGENNISLKETLGNYNKLFEYYSNGYKIENTSGSNQVDLDLTQIQNQIMRIKDARIGATKMVLMHVVTGQEYKHSMVMETIGLTETLYEATQIEFNKKGEEALSQTELTGSIKPVMLGGQNKYNFNFDFIELID